MVTLADLRAINARVNQAIRYTPDSRDHWQTPKETFERGQGDCEDYAIAKLAAVLAEGHPTDDVRLVYCKQVFGGMGQAHMVVEVRLQGQTWVLDNLGLAINQWRDRRDLRPLFSFNATGFWVKGRLTNVDPQERLGQWKHCVSRALQEGSPMKGVAL